MLTTDLNMYFYVKDINEINNKYFISLTNDLNSLKKELVGKNDMIAITSLKYGTPVIYSPYYLDFGNIYSKKSQVKMEIKEMSKFELLIDVDDIVITINNDDNYSSVVDYVSKRRVEGNITVAEEINSTAQLRFCRLALVNGISSKNQNN